MSFATLIRSIISIASILVLSTALANEPSMDDRVSWQPMMLSSDENDNDILVAYDTPKPYHFSTDARLSPNQSIAILLDGGSALFIQFLDDEDDRHKSNHFSLVADVSSSPGLARKHVFDSNNGFLPQSNQNRVIVLTNRNDSDISIRALQTIEQSPTSFAPLSWLTPENQRKEQRIHSTLGQSYDVHKSDTYAEYQLEEEKTYWIDGFAALTPRWPRERHEVWQLSRANNMQTKLTFDQSNPGYVLFSNEVKVRQEVVRVPVANELQTQLTFDRANPGRVLLPVEMHSSELSLNTVHSDEIASIEEHVDRDYYARLTPVILESDATDTYKLQSLADTYSRVQDVEEDWLFSDNFDTYSAPDVARRKAEQAFSTHLQQMAHDPQSQQLTRHRLPNQNESLSNGMYQTLAQWTKSVPMKPHQIGKVKLVTEENQPKNYTFTDDDLQQHFSPVVLPSHTAKGQYFKSLEGQEMIFHAPFDAISNMLELQVSRQSLAGKHAKLFIQVDDGPTQEFVPFDTLPWQQYTQNRGWLSSSDTETVGYSAQDTLHLPQGWRQIRVSTEGEFPPFRLRYESLNTPELDEQHWVKWLQKAWMQQAGSPKEDPQREGMLSFNDIVSSHPQYLALNNYLTVKANQFSASNDNLQLLKLIRENTAVPGLFSAQIPDVLPQYQQIISLLKSPKGQHWNYWNSLIDALIVSGWEGFAGQLLQHLVVAHPDPYIRLQAIISAHELLSSEKNRAALISVLAFGYLNASQEQDTQRTAILLAEQLILENESAYALFLLLKFQPTQQAIALAHIAASQLNMTTFVANLNGGSTADVRESDAKLLTLSGKRSAFTQISGVSPSNIVDLYNKDLDLFQRNYLAKPSDPLTIETANNRDTSSTTFLVTARIWHTEGTETQDDWLNIKTRSGHHRLPLFSSSFISGSLLSDKGSVGSGHRFIVTVPTAESVDIFADNNDVTVHYRELINEAVLQHHRDSCSRDNTIGADSELIKEKSEPELLTCYLPVLVEENTAAFTVSGLESVSLPDDYWTVLNELDQFEQSSDPSRLVRINELIHKWPDSALKNRLERRTNRNTEWLTQSNPVKAKKFTFRTFDTNEPMTPNGIRSRLLYNPQQSQTERLSTQSVLNYELEVRKGEQLRLELESQRHLFLAEQSSRVVISINDKIVKHVNLSTNEKKYIPLSLEQGQHKLSLQLLDTDAIASVIASLQFKLNEESWQEQPQDIRLRLYQADKDTPFQLFVPELSWLRIDTYDKKGLVNSEFVTAPQGIFSWAGSDNDEHAFRVMKLQMLDDDKPNAATGSINSLQAQEKDHSPKHSLAITPYSYKPKPDAPELREHDATQTWGLELNRQKRRSVQEDQAQTNELTEVVLHSLKADKSERYYLGQSFALRDYDAALNNSLHAAVEWWDTEWRDAIQLQIGANVAAQQGSTSDDWAWSSRFNIAAHGIHSWDNRLFNRWHVDLWGRLLDHDRNTAEYATSVYSQYKLDHRYGISIADHLRYKLTHDSDLRASIRVNSNPLFEDFGVDNLISVVGARFFYQGLAADINWRYQRFLKDDHRRVASGDSRLGLSFDWFAWQESSHFRLRFGLERDLLNDENFWSIRLIYLNDNGRGVRDYVPQSLAFKPLRHQQFILQPHQ